jgi:catechol 2,3-dioxygenase-like lactoylglutathione lyase family enzyme
MLLKGINHVAVLTNDTARLHAFYHEVFDATVSRDSEVPPGVRLSFIDIGPGSEFNVFHIDGNTEAQRLRLASTSGDVTADKSLTVSGNRVPLARP